MSTTPFQPTLPAEGEFSDAEFAFIEESPPIFPENQNSNFGLLRKLWTDKVQELITQQNTIYNEKFVDTSSLFLDVWEKEVGLPGGRGAARSEAQRRLDVLARLQKGPFTRPYRASIIEAAITATFGAPVALSPTGIPLSASGVPLYSESADVKTLYSVRENMGVYNGMSNGNFESDVAGWGSDGTCSAITRQAGGKVGQYALRATAAATTPYVYNQAIPVNVGAGNSYVVSGWIYRQSRAGDIALTVQWRDAGSAVVGSSAVIVSAVPQGTWTFISDVFAAPPGATQGLAIFQWSNSQVGDFGWLDAVQFAGLKNPISGKNVFPYGGFESGVPGWWGPGTITLDNTRHDGNYAAHVVFVSGNYIGSYAAPGTLRAGDTFMVSAWVYATGADVGKLLRFQLNETGGAITDEGSGGNTFTLASGWQRFSFPATIIRGDRTNIYLLIAPNSGALTMNIDSVQIERGSTLTAYTPPVLAASFVDYSKTPYYYEVRIKNTITPDMVSLNRELKRITPSGITFDVLQVPDV